MKKGFRKDFLVREEWLKLEVILTHDCEEWAP